MPMSELPHRVVFCACPSPDVAEKIASMLVAKGLAACVNIIPGVRSIYKWEGKIEDESELLMIIKTHQERLPDLRQAILEQHPYEVPEIIDIKIDGGSVGYLSWLDKETGLR